MKTKKSISELIDEEVKRNPILSDEEIEEMFEPTSEDIPFDKKTTM